MSDKLDAARSALIAAFEAFVRELIAAERRERKKVEGDAIAAVIRKVVMAERAKTRDWKV